MRTPSRDATFDRVIVLLDVTSDHLPALESGAALAARLQIPLVTLFAEARELLALEGHPLVRTIDLPTGMGRSVEQGSMRRHWRALARRTHNRLALLARHYRLEADFRILGGDLRQQLGELGTSRDLMVVESAGRMVTKYLRMESQGHCIGRSLPAPVVFVGARPSHMRSVVLVYDGSPTSERGLDTALQLTADDASLLSLVWVGESANEIRELTTRVQRRLARQRRRIHVHARRIACHETGAIGSIASQMGANFLIVPACDIYPGEADIDRLSRELDCPVLILRSQFGDESDDPDRRRAAVEG